MCQLSPDPFQNFKTFFEFARTLTLFKISNFSECQNPAAVAELQSQWVEGCRSPSLFAPTKALALAELETLLPHYLHSDEFYNACRHV